MTTIAKFPAYTVMQALNVKTGTLVRGVISGDEVTLRLDVNDLENYVVIENGKTSNRPVTFS